MAEKIQHQDVVPDSCLGKRLDQTIAQMFPDYSRSRLKDWILDGSVQVDGEVISKARIKMAGGETITLYLGPARQTEQVVQDIIKAAPKRVIFNPDTENKTTAEQLKKAGIEVVEACTLVLLKTNQY